MTDWLGVNPSDEDWYRSFLIDERLPPTFIRTVARVCSPLAEAAARVHLACDRTVVIGICGAQGSGKSTIASATGRLLEARGLRVAVLSLDDLYHTRRERERLANELHPLFLTRGPPGTHDVELGAQILDALSGAGNVALPRFDKALDTRLPRTEWGCAPGPVDVLLFEGWCVGARPENTAALLNPCNLLVEKLDQDRRWRTYVNEALGNRYAELFRRIDFQVLLQAPSFEVVRAWRNEQETKLRERLVREGSAASAMSEIEVNHFISHFERLTRHILSEMPFRADWVVPLGPDRTPYPD